MLNRTKHVNLYHIVDNGKLDYDKGGILFDISDKPHFNMSKCKNFNLIFGDRICFEVINQKISYYTANNGYKYLIVKIKDLDTLPKDKVSLIFQEEKISDVTYLDGVTVFKVKP